MESQEGHLKKFDLNIEKVLEDWETYHAIREVIANALDEQSLTQTQDIQISKDKKGAWHIRDFGRGLRYEHLTQKENDEKIRSPYLIGKFGVGLKDALATFDRRGVKVFIKSAHGDITLGKSQKHDFEDIFTLHAYVSPPSDSAFAGTEFILEGCKASDVEKAKNLFLKFSGERVVERTDYGEVLEKKGTPATIYINGVRVAEEENFLFSYNITSITQAIKRALNRERTNVGRNAYTDRIKSILLDCKTTGVAKRLVGDLKEYETGRLHDELKWTDVAVRACQLLNSQEKVVFFTPNEMIYGAEMIDRARDAGYEIITVPESIKEKIKGQKDILGNPILDLLEFTKQWNESFAFKFVDPKDLKPREMAVFKKTTEILKLIGGKPRQIREIKISEIMKVEGASFSEADGLWEMATGRIIVKRSQLRSLEAYAGTLLHEVAHALSGALDVSRGFEDQLSEMLGIVASGALD